MSLRLETSVGTPLVRAVLALALTVALTVAMVALSPAAAEAQASSQTEDRSAPTVVVRPGDSLWSISEGRLGPNAIPRRVMKGVERIHALNRARIGADPDLIFMGQELSLPPAMSGPPTGATVPAREAAEASGSEASGSGQRARAAKGSAGKEAPRKAAGRGAIPRSKISLEEAAEMLGAETAGKEALPEPRAVAPVPVVGAVATKGAPFGLSAYAQMEERRLLGLGIVVLTPFVVALMAWKLPLRRATREDAERWGMSYGYYGETTPASGTTPFFYHPGTLGVPLGDRDEQDARRAVFVGGGTASSPRVARETGAPAGQGRAPKARAKVRARTVPRNGLALGAHNREVRRAPQRARAAMRARRLRPRLRPKGVSARGGR